MNDPVRFSLKRRALLDVSEELEAIRPQRAVATGREQEFPAVFAAWDTALARFEKACAEYAEAAK